MSVDLGRTVTPRRLIVLTYVVLLCVFGGWAGAMFLEARGEYLQLRQVQAAGEARLAAAEARFKEQEIFLKRLRNDPDFAEHVIRQQLGYGRKGEVVIRFDPGF
ncbi:MAG: septum formation initiator family protein [Opitutaceae bacterium]|nr:septum formation initiator family protein [Opitutaceae bacterium]